MGHTVWSQRIAFDIALDEMKEFSKALAKEDREILDNLLKHAYKHIGSISYASSYQVWAFILLSILVEKEKQAINRKSI